jgi:hypothetical protein
LVPLAPSWVVSLTKRCIARLIPDRQRKRFGIEVLTGVSDEDLEHARQGTLSEGSLAYTLDGIEHRTPIKTLRGDRRVDGTTANNLRLWEKRDVVPRAEDLLQERLFCIQWATKSNPSETFFRGVSASDLAAELKVLNIVETNLSRWQTDGLVPDMTIATGEKTDEPIRTRGWTHWHHLFVARSLHYMARYQHHCAQISDPIVQGALSFNVNSLADCSSRLSRWEIGSPRPDAGGGPPGDAVKRVFYNMALNPMYVYGARSFWHLNESLSSDDFAASPLPKGIRREVSAHPAAAVATECEIFLTDPPYADAVAYEEITEFFIAWQRKNPPAPFASWTWDSRRDLAVRGSGDAFRREMVRAYSEMTQHMPDNGMQIVMFTHQDGGVWADMANIFWGAGLKVTAAWYIATETTSELKKGGYVQGTVILVLRKRIGNEKTYTNEVVEEVRREVAHQIETLTGLNQSTRAGRDENLFNDADLQMAGFAAALRVLTSYTHIDDQDMTREALRPRVKGETTLADRIIEHAVSIANEFLVPEGLDAKVWDRLNGSERFYLRMLDVEEAGAKKLDSYQNFAKAFKVKDFGPLMASQKPNDARLKSASDLKKAEFAGSEFGTSTLRAVLYALYELQSEIETDDVMSHLRDGVTDYMRKRDLIVAMTRFLDLKLTKARPAEAEAARVLTGLIKNERVGG